MYSSPVVFPEITGQDLSGNGFIFAGYSAHELYEACCHAQDAYNNKENWHNLVHHCMECDFSWDVSAKSYEGLYNETANLW